MVSNIWWLQIVTCISSMTALSSRALLRWLGDVISHRVECIVYSHMNSFLLLFSVTLWQCLQSYMQYYTYIHTYKQYYIYIHTYIYIYIHTYIHTYIHIYIHTYSTTSYISCIIYYPRIIKCNKIRILKPTLYLYILYPPLPLYSLSASTLTMVMGQ
jgi:hypothetical protein